MIEIDKLDRIERSIGGDWSCDEFICVTCPKCGEETDSVMTYPDMTLYWHSLPGTEIVFACTINKGAEPITYDLEPFFEAVPEHF